LLENLIVEIKITNKENPTMGKDKQETENGLPEIGASLDDLVRRGARQVIQQAGGGAQRPFAGTRSADRSRSGDGQGAESARQIGDGREVQFDDRGALCEAPRGCQRRYRGYN
jgi:hypothetical protein